MTTFLKHVLLNVALLTGLYLSACFVAWEWLYIPPIALRGGVVALPFLAVISLAHEMVLEMRNVRFK